MRTRCLVALVAGVALTLAFPETHLFWLLPFAVAAFFWCTDLPLRRAWVPGLVFGASFQITLLWWLHVMGVVPWLGLALTQTVWYGALGAAAVPLRRLPLAPVWLAAAWVAMESVRCTWPAGGMPWGRLAYAVVGTPVEEAAPFLGSTGLSLVLALAGALLAAACPPAARRAQVAAGGAALALLALASVPLLTPYSAPSAGHVRVAAVQGNVPGDGTQVLAHFRQITVQHRAETEKLARDVSDGRAPRPDFVVWPENSTALDPFEDPQMRQDIEDAVHTIDVPLLAGVVVDGGPRHVLNQGIVFDPVTGAGDRYTKWHPVPFGEYVPWRWAFGSHLSELNRVPRDMVGGRRVEPLRIAGTPVADAICFDVAYDDGLYAQLSHGAQLVVVQTSNALFIHTAQIDQQFAISRLRALETHRYVVVAAINGITGVIAPDGSVESSVPALTRSYVDSEVDLYADVTPAVRMGAWPGRLCCLLVVTGWALATGQYRRNRAGSAADPAASRRAPTDRINA
jgi:apolipoprotein N-acyltransferase